MPDFSLGNVGLDVIIDPAKAKAGSAEIERSLISVDNTVARLNSRIQGSSSSWSSFNAAAARSLRSTTDEVDTLIASANEAARANMQVGQQGSAAQKGLAASIKESTQGMRDLKSAAMGAVGAFLFFTQIDSIIESVARSGARLAGHLQTAYEYLSGITEEQEKQAQLERDAAARRYTENLRGSIKAEQDIAAIETLDKIHKLQDAISAGDRQAVHEMTKNINLMTEGATPELERFRQLAITAQEEVTKAARARRQGRSTRFAQTQAEIDALKPKETAGKTEAEKAAEAQAALAEAFSQLHGELDPVLAATAEYERKLGILKATAKAYGDESGMIGELESKLADVYREKLNPELAEQERLRALLAEHEQNRLRMVREELKTTAKEAQEAIDEIIKAMEEGERARDAQKGLIEDIYGEGAQSIVGDLHTRILDVFAAGEFGWREFAQQAARAAAEVALKMIELQILMSAFGLQQDQAPGSIGSILYKAFGFQTGGRFVGQGAGGKDSIPVFFRISPGEEVSVKPPGVVQRPMSDGGGGGGPITVINRIDAGQQADALLAAASTPAFGRVIINHIQNSPELIERALRNRM